MFTPTIKLEHSDSRGEIYSITLPDDKELMLLHSTKGSLRGGHSHDVDELVVMLTGKMRYHKLVGNTEEEFDLVAGRPSRNNAGVVHMGEFLEDSWLLEFKIGTNKHVWKNTNYEAWRERVNANAEIAAYIV